MMEAIYLELLPQILGLEREWLETKDIWVDTGEFRQALMRAGYNCPTGAAPSTDSRFRLFLKVPGRPELTGVYYVGGYQDKGTVSLDWDPDQGHIIPRRREAIKATQAKNRAEAEVIL